MVASTEHSETSGERSPLSRDRVLREAVSFADADGLSAVSMRKLAGRLGFEVMSLYNHIENKGDLHRGMADAVASEVPVPGDADGWRGPIRQHAIDTKSMFMRHPWAVMLWVSTIPGPVRFDHMEWQLKTLANANLDEVAAHHAFHAITTHTVGYSLHATLMDVGDDLDAVANDVHAGLDPRLHEHTRAHIRQHLDGHHGPSFEFVLDLLLDGIAALDAGRAR